MTQLPAKLRPRLSRLYEIRRQVEDEIASIETAIAVARNRSAAHDRSAVCGTDAGYYRHRRKLNEPACADCRRAHAAAERRRREMSS